MRIAQRHPVNEVQHPWALVRGQLGLSQEALAKKAGVTTHTVVKAEKSLFREPPEKILKVLKKGLVVEGWSYDPGLEESYKNYQTQKRKVFKGRYPDFKELQLVGTQHPLILYRGACGLSRIGFCGALCVHPYPVEEWEKRRRREIPLQIKEAFEEAGIDPEPLMGAVEEWRRL